MSKIGSGRKLKPKSRKNRAWDDGSKNPVPRYKWKRRAKGHPEFVRFSL